MGMMGCGIEEGLGGMVGNGWDQDRNLEFLGAPPGGFTVWLDTQKANHGSQIFLSLPPTDSKATS